MRTAVILGAARTPIGRFLGGLASIPAPRLGSIAIAEALRRAEVPKDQVDEVIVGNVLGAGLGQAPARQATLYAGLPTSVPATTINKMCGSGLKAVMLAAQAIIPVEIPHPKGEPQVVAEDEEPRRVDFDKPSTLRPAFEEGGTVTAGNASSLSDGAAAVVVAAEEVAQRRGWKPLARIVGQAGAAMAPEWFTIAPAQATTRLLEKVGWQKEDVDLFEINEAFAAVVLGVCRDLGIALDRVNVHGGAVALGHPVGCSGARILTTLLYAMPRYEARRGVAAICLAGGEAVALAVERLWPASA